MPDAGGEGEILALVLDQVRRFAAREIDSAAIDREAQIPPSVLRTAGELGLFGLTIPEEHGGMGLSMSAATRVIIELAKVDRSVATSIGLHCGLGLRGLIELGSPELQGQWLPRLATGEIIASFAATEPGAGSDLTAVRTTAVEQDGELTIDGEKAYVTNGAFAGLVTILARTPGIGGARAHCLIAVPTGIPGVHIGPEEHKLGIRGSSTVTVTYENARVPMGNIIGEPGAGMKHAHRVLEWGRTLMSAGCVGTAKAALAATLDHVVTRKQFGKPIGHFAASRAHVARMAGKVCAMESIVEHVARLEGLGESIAIPSAAAKVFCSEGAFDVCDTAIQLHGALGFIEETGIARMLRDCRITRIFEGANDVLLVHTGAALLGGLAGVRRLHGDLSDGQAEGGQAWERTERRLEEAVVAVKSRLGVGAVRHQLLLQRLARAHMAQLAASACMRGEQDGNGTDALVVAYAVVELTSFADGQLDLLQGSEADAVRDAAVTDSLYSAQDGLEKGQPSKQPEARS